MSYGHQEALDITQGGINIGMILLMLHHIWNLMLADGKEYTKKTNNIISAQGIAPSIEGLYANVTGWNFYADHVLVNTVLRKYSILDHVLYLAFTLWGFWSNCSCICNPKVRTPPHKYLASLKLYWYINTKTITKFYFLIFWCEIKMGWSCTRSIFLAWKRPIYI